MCISVSAEAKRQWNCVANKNNTCNLCECQHINRIVTCELRKNQDTTTHAHTHTHTETHKHTYLHEIGCDACVIKWLAKKTDDRKLAFNMKGYNRKNNTNCVWIAKKCAEEEEVSNVRKIVGGNSFNILMTQMNLI